jgi:AcrR family transcriptional regulator
MPDAGLEAMAKSKRSAGAAQKQASKPGTLPGPTRRERAKQEKLSRIIAVAKRLFDEKGFLATTTQEIAEKSDIGTGTLFLYAKSKEDLLILVFMDEMNLMLQNAFKKTPAKGAILDQLLHVFGLMVAYHNRDIELSKLLIKEVTISSSEERRDEIRALMRGIYSSLADLITAGQRKGAMRKNVDPFVAAEGLFSIYYLGLIGWLGGHATKQQFLERLRVQLAVMTEGLVERAASAR